jgi:hypothetical protein
MDSYSQNDILLGVRVRKFICLLAASVGLASSLQAMDCGCCCRDPRWEMQFRAAGFRPQSDSFQRVYGHWAPAVEFQLERVFCRNWSFWANIDYTWKNGHSSQHDSTHLSVLPLSVGVKGTYFLTDDFGVYMGLGPTYAWLRIHDHSSHVIEHVRKSSWGGVAKLGFTWLFACHGLLDLFADYNYQHFHFHDTPSLIRHNANLSGWRFGGGLGITW